MGPCLASPHRLLPTPTAQPRCRAGRKAAQAQGKRYWADARPLWALMARIVDKQGSPRVAWPAELGPGGPHATAFVQHAVAFGLLQPGDTAVEVGEALLSRGPLLRAWNGRWRAKTMGRQ